MILMKIHALRNRETGETAPPHQIGTDKDGQALYAFVDGWDPVGADGHLLDTADDGTECLVSSHAK